jgi:hypothetical protein
MALPPALICKIRNSKTSPAQCRGSSRKEAKMNKYIGKIIIVTNMRKIPRSCAECGYYDGMGNRPGGRYNDGICTAGASIYSTRGIRVSKERLKNCPLHMIGRDNND